MLDASGHLGAVDDRGRSVTSPDGSTETVATPGLMGGEPVPARLGGGFLFWSPGVLYRARTFLGPLEPVAPLPTNAITVAFGHDSLLVFEPEGHRKAYSLDLAKRVPLSPHGVVDIAGADDDRVVAIDAPGRALTSIDGGKTWSDVTAQLGGSVSRLRGEPTRVGFEVNDKDAMWLQSDGRLERGALNDAHPARPGGEASTAASWLPMVVENGVPLPDGRVLVGRGPAAVVVDLASGAETHARPIGPEGSSCRAVSADDDGVFICYAYGLKKSTFAIVSGALGAAPRVERQFDGTPSLSYAAGVLVVGASCDGTVGATAAACVRRGSGVWTPYDVLSALPAKGEVEGWVPRQDGGAVAIAMQREIGRVKLSLVDAAHGTVAPLDAEIGNAGPGFPFGRLMKNWVVTRDGMLRGFTRTGSVVVDPHGHVTAGSQVFKNVSVTDGGRALARDESRRLWQTTDYGDHWVEVAPPPMDPGPEDGRVAGPSYIDSGISEASCSLVGCLMAHPSRAGRWVRLGWPNDPPQTAGERSDAGARAIPAPTSDGGQVQATAAPPPSPSPAPVRIRCVAQGVSTSPAPAPYAAPESAADAEWQAVLGGQRVLKQRGDHAYGIASYQDHFAGAGDTIGPQSIGHALRAVAHYEMPAGAANQVLLSRLVEVKGPLESLFVEPFDPTGRIVRAAGSFASWPASPKPGAASGAPKPAPRFGDYIRRQALPADARPVLSNEAGHADGVLLIGDGLSFWASRAGAVRPVVAGRDGCSLFGGYVDRRGKLLVACEDSMGSAEIREADTGTVRMRSSRVLPLSIRAMKGEGPRSPYPKVPAHVFTDPDSIAVSGDGKLGLLRMPSGFEPSTVDDPAWLLAEGAPPVELAPWSTLEGATSPACSHGADGVRAIVQTALPWVTVDDSSGFARTPGMTALVRWSPQRVCLEALEVGYREIEDGNVRYDVMAAVRFVGSAPGSGFVGTSATAASRQRATCQLE